MADKSQGLKGLDRVLSLLNMAVGALDRAKEATNATPAKAAFTSAGILLTMIRDSMANKMDYVELGLTCSDVCEVLNRGIDGKRADQISRAVLEAVEKLTTIEDEIQTHIIKRSKRNAISRRYHAKDDEEAIAAWKLDLDGILHVFNTKFGVKPRATGFDTRRDAAKKPITGSDVANTHAIVSDPHREVRNREGAGGRNQATHASAPGESTLPLPGNTRGIASDIHHDVVNTRTVVNNIHNMLKSQEGAGYKPQLAQNSVHGELPPPPPRGFFGRNELIEKIVRFAQNLTPIALVGAGGIGKTSIILTVLHDDRIRQRFGDNRRFIRCDQFPASHTHFLRQLSKVIGAGIENPEDLAPLRPYLSSREMLIVLDNAESVLDPQGSSARRIYAVVDELVRFSNICLCITSRISTIPPHCETLQIPTLSMEAGCGAFYRIYKHGERCDPINDILKQLDFHPLSITLLATVAQHNTWDANRLAREWKRQRTGVLHAQHSGSLAATIELSLSSPMFRELGPDARELLGVVAFFPQGINEKNIDWLFPTVSNGPNTFDTFCILSLTHRSNGFITMLAPLRDHLHPKGPTSSPLLTTTEECYFSRLSTYIHPDDPGFKESQWITEEDVNVEHLLDVIISIDPSSKNLWDVCAKFMDHLYWHKPRLVMLGPKIMALPDDHPSKTQCLADLSRLFYSVGNWVEYERLLTNTIKLSRERGDDYEVARGLSNLCEANRLMGLHKEGVQQAKEASEIFERLGDTAKQAGCLIDLAWVLHDDEQLDAAEEAASRAIEIIPEEGGQFLVCRDHRVIGEIYDSKGNTEKAIRHFETAIEIASPLSWHGQLFWVHFALADLFYREGRFDDAHVHIERAKSHAVNDAYKLARAMEEQARFWCGQCRFEKAKFEASHAVEVYGELGATYDLGRCRGLLQWIDEQMNNPVAPEEPDVDGRETEQIAVASVPSEGSLRNSPSALSPH